MDHQKTNGEALRKMQPDARFLDSILQKKLGLVGYILKEENGIGRGLLLGSIHGPWGRGRPTT